MDTGKLKAKLATVLANSSLVHMLDEETPLEHYFEITERLDTSILDSSGCIRDGVLTALDCIDLVAYQHPEAESILKVGIRAILLAVIEAQSTAVGCDTDAQVVRSVREELSSNARKAANASHKHTNLQKVAALEEWDKHGEKVSSMAAFARARHKEFGVHERTLYGWVREHCKTKN